MDRNTPQLQHQYILDYLNRSEFHLTAAAFEVEADLSHVPPPLPVFGGLLTDLWDISRSWNRVDEHTSQTFLNRYIFYYFKRRGFHKTAACFPIETELNHEPPPPPATGRILSDWWSKVYDIFRTKMQNTLKERHLFLNRNVSSNPQIQTPANLQIQTRLTVAEQSAEQGDQNDAIDFWLKLYNSTYFTDTNVINISSSSDKLQTSSCPEQDSLSSLIPRGKPLTHFLDDFPQESETSKPESSLPAKQKGTSNVPGKVFRGGSRQHQTTGQLRLNPNSNKGDEVAKDDMPVEKDDPT